MFQILWNNTQCTQQRHEQRHYLYTLSRLLNFIFKQPESKRCLFFSKYRYNYSFFSETKNIKACGFLHTCTPDYCLQYKSGCTFD